MNEGLKVIFEKLKKRIDSAKTELYYRKYFEWRLPTRPFIQVNMETNSVCTRKCHFCLFGIKDVPVKKMSPRLFFSIINQLADMRFRGRISLFEINEPLTDKRIYDFTRYVSILLPDCYQLMVTNGDLLNRERLDALMDNGVDLLVINSYDRKALERNRVNARYGIEKYHGMVQHCDKTTFTEWVSRAGHIKQYAKEAVHDFCEYPNYILYIKPDGKVLGCWHDFDEENVMGDLNQELVRDIWYGKRFKDFRKALNRGDRSLSTLCKRCDHRPDINYMRWNRMLAHEKCSDRHASNDNKVRRNEVAAAIKRKYL